MALSVSGHKLPSKGLIDLTVKVGTIERTVPFVVVEQLHEDAILGTDALCSFRAVIDMEIQTLTLKSSGDILPLGSARAEETYVYSLL